MRQDQLFMTIVQTQCCQFFKMFLIKKDVFYKGLSVLLPRGRSYLQLEKLQLEKIKTKKGLCTIQKSKN